MVKDLVLQPVNQSPHQLIEEEENLKVEIVCHVLEAENVCVLEPNTICTTNLCSESPSNRHSKTKLVQELKKWALKHDIQQAAFSSLLKILSSYYPELELEKAFDDLDFLNKDISVNRSKEASISKSGSSSSVASCISEAHLDPFSEEENCSDLHSRTPRLSKRRRISCRKTAEFSLFKDELLQICRSELRQVCQDEFSKWNQNCSEHAKIVRGVAADLKHVKEELKSVKNMMPLLSKLSKR